jgi:hypothetical protein
VDKVKGVTPKGEVINQPKYTANAKAYGSEPIIQNVVPETSALQKEPVVGDMWKSMVSPIKLNK